MIKVNNKSGTLVRYLAISKSGQKILEIGDKSSDNIISLTHDDYDIQTVIDYNSVIEKQKALEDIENLLNILKSSQTIFPDDTLVELFDMILQNKSIDDILYYTLKHLIESKFTDKIAFFILNDKLIKLKGVVYVKKNNGDTIFDNTLIKTCTIDISKRGKISDALFFDRIELIQFEELTCKNISNFFDNKVILSPVYNNKGAIGCIILECSENCLKNIMLIKLTSRLVSIAIDHSRITKQLRLAMSDVSYFKESIEVSSNLTHMGKLTASVAHEIKNPLVSIGGFAKRLEKYITDERGLSYLKIIQSETTRLEQIVNDILTYSRVFSIKREPTNICLLLTEIESFFKDELTLHNIELIVNCTDDITLNLDAKKIKQVFVNLIKNSIQSIGSNGKIKIDVEKRADGIEIIIKDTGEGFPIEIIQRAFEPFVTTKELGTGLGLSICHKIISAHHGKISIDNYDNGAIVKIDLPIEGDK